MKIVPHPLLTPRDLQQFVIGIDVPLKIESELFERLVECDPMSILLSIDDHPILIEEQSLDFRHSLCLSR
ncbi:hypothetical protein ES708_05022 [subsurface metagenome]